MDSTCPTLLDHLTQPNPPLTVEGQPQKASSTQRSHYPIPNAVRYSTWFNRRLVDLMFDGRLRNELETRVDASAVRSASLQDTTEIWEEACFLRGPGKTVTDHVNIALRSTRRSLPAQSIAIVPGSNAILYDTEGHGSVSDWAGVRHNLPRSKEGRGRPYNVLPGDAKPSWKCNKRLVQNAIKQEQKRNERGGLRSLWPFRQLLHYCLAACSHYGYILTDQEALIVRVTPPRSSETRIQDVKRCREWLQQNAVMEYFSVPWCAHGKSNKMTVCLALWTLHILSANNGYFSTQPFLELRDEQLETLEDQTYLPFQQQTSTSASTSFDTSGDIGVQRHIEDSFGSVSAAEDGSQANDPFVTSFGSQSSGLGSKRKRSSDEWVEEYWISLTGSNMALPRSPHITRSRSTRTTMPQAAFDFETGQSNQIQRGTRLRAPRR